MAQRGRPSAEEIILYAKDPKTKIATITFNRPEFLNAPTTAGRLRYAELLHGANVDDDVRVVAIRGVGDDFGSGADLPEVIFMQKAFFELVKQHQGKYMGSMLSALFESMGSAVRPDGDDMMLGDAIVSGLADSVRDNDAKFPPDFRLSKSGRAKQD
jgi:hypothetical protein